MVSLKTISGIAISLALISILGCSEKEDAAESAVSTPLAVAESDTPQSSAADGDGPRPSPEERAAAAKEQMEKSASAAFSAQPLIDPNTATAEQLAQVPGLTEAAAQAVVENRPYATPSELHAVISDGMSEDDLFTVYSAMFVKVKLNSSANEDFRLVPSTLSARKLAHEFEEYRPYSSIEDFRREMKKYVSEAEVAFLERYVIVD